jgi:hypothetical protein
LGKSRQEPEINTIGLFSAYFLCISLFLIMTI